MGGAIYQVQFVCFHAFTVLLVFNAVTAIIIDTTSQSTRSVREYVIHQEIESQHEFCKSMKNIFDEIDRNGNGKVTKEELLDALDLQHIGPYFSGLGIDVQQADDLFEALDTDGDGEVDRIEFMLGCLPSRARREAQILQCGTWHS